jgi:hypothetical protein
MLLLQALQMPWHHCQSYLQLLLLLLLLLQALQMPWWLDRQR